MTVRCEEKVWDASDFWKNFSERVLKERVPTSVSISLTHRCNLKCVHCYIREEETSKNPPELTTKEWLNLIDEMTNLGCMDVLFTGGDPLLRTDFCDIYRRAKENGLSVVVFTNGTLFTDEILDLFEKLPPNHVDITLYAATEETYQKVTCTRGALQKCMENIKKLNERKIRFKIKTILMTLNSHEFFAIQDIAKKYDAKFRFDPAINPCADGNMAPLNLRVTAEEAISKEIDDDEESMTKLIEYYEKNIRDIKPYHDDYMFKCGAGISTFHLDPYGNMQPCISAVKHHFSILESGLTYVWKNLIPKVREKKVSPNHACNTCTIANLCNQCVAFGEIENSSEDPFSEYCCQLGKLRLKKILEKIDERDHKKS